MAIKIILVAVSSTSRVCSRSIAEVASSNYAAGMHVCLVFLLFVMQIAASAKSWSLVRRSPTVCFCFCLILFQIGTSTVRRSSPELGWWATNKEKSDQKKKATGPTTLPKERNYPFLFSRKGFPFAWRGYISSTHLLMPTSSSTSWNPSSSLNSSLG